MGRLRVSHDEYEQDARTYYIYDHLGRLTGEVNTFGNLTEYVYDIAGRLTGTIRYEAASRFDLVKSLETQPDQATRIAQIRPTSDGNATREWTVYDANDRVVQRIDGTGAVTSYAYDAMGRQVRATAHATAIGDVALASLIANGAPATPWPVVADNARDATTRTFYDRQGNVRGTLDGEGYLVEHIYDKAGRRIETVAYGAAATGHLRATGTLGQLIGDVQPRAENRLTRFVHDAMGVLRYEIGPQNRVT